MDLFKTLFSQRAPTLQGDPGESTLLEMLSPRHGSAPAPRGTSGMLQAYSTSPWVRAAVSKIGDMVGSTKWYLFAYQNASTKYQVSRVLRDRKDGSLAGLRKTYSQNVVDLQGDLREIVEHPFLRLLDGNNPVYPGHVGRALTQSSIDLVGEGYWLLDPVDNPVGAPEQFWFIPPHWVTGLPSEGNPVWEVQGPNFKIEVPVGAMLRFVQPDPYNPYLRGSGHLRSMGDEIDVYEFASKHIRAWFKNRAIPDILVYGSNMDSSDTKRLEEHWTSKLRGFTRSHLPLFLRAKDINVKELSQKFSDMQLSTLKKDDRDTIIHGLGFPPEIFGILESSNRSTIDAADYLMGRYVVIPRLELLRAFMQAFLLPRYDDRLILAYESPVAEDREFQLEVMKAMPSAYRVNDWRELSGHELVEPMDDVFLVNYNVQLKESLEPVVIPALQPGAPPSNNTPPEDDDTLEEPPEDQATPRIAPTFAQGAQATQPCGCEHDTPAQASVGAAITNILVKEGLGGEAAQRIALKLSTDMQKAVLDAWAQLRNEVDLRQLQAALENGTYESLLRDLASKDAIYEDAVAVLQQAVALVGDAAAGELGDFINGSVDFALTNPRAVEELERIGADMVTNVSDETITAIRDALVDAYRNGRTGNQVAQDIRDMIGLTQRDVAQLGRLRDKLQGQVTAGDMTQAQVDKFLDKWVKAKIRYRAHVIADHELNTAGNAGQQLLWEQGLEEGLIPPTARRSWITTPDDRTCPLCAPMNGETTGIMEPWYTTTGAAVMIPQEIHVRCRCTFQVVFTKA